MFVLKKLLRGDLFESGLVKFNQKGKNYLINVLPLANPPNIEI